MYDLLAIGESLIDFTPAGTNDQAIQLFGCNPGGAPANVLAMYQKLGGQTSFVGKVGNDSFGHFLIENMQKAGIDTSYVQLDQEIPTTLAFVQLDEKGDRSFSFYRKPGADIRLCWDEMDQTIFTQCKIFHFGSVSLTDEPCRTATLNAMKAAKQAGALISYDPNYRPFLWDDEAFACTQMKEPISSVDVLKVSEEEMILLTGETDLEKGAQALRKLGPAVVVVTLGENGSLCCTKDFCLKVPAYRVKTIDTNGAGDAFWGAFLWQLSDASFADFSEKEWQHILSFSNAAGSLTTTKKGAIPAMPNQTEIEQCMQSIS